VHLKGGGGRANLDLVLKELGEREILSVLLEAGPVLNGAALSSGIVNKLVLFYAPKLAGATGVPLAKLTKGVLSALRIRTIRQFGLELIRQNS
jgi:diaminohydroxyphosphoribosylaminopyrimidine deaminase/5-amino-6-(5-phosphoribosylamino)uracil reductase